MEKADKVTMEEVEMVLHGIYDAACKINGDQNNHLIAIAIQNDASRLHEKIEKEKKDAEK